MAEASWLQDMARRVREVERDEAGNITTASFMNVCEGNQPIFRILFSGTLTQAVGSQLLASNRDGVAQVRKDAAEVGDAASTVIGLVRHQLSKLGPELCGKPGERNATKSILWLNRELVFISMVLRLMASGLESGDAGYQAYEVVIKRYHPWVVQKVVGAAVGHVPTIQEILVQLKIPSKEEGFRQVELFCDLTEALSAEISALLEKEGANFQGQA
eukprot:CAMPEP_0195572536 /NCGR_PEP_ID=MMETSP0814-20130614/4794_1 /TAXON_ID=97485 /ORGANISM="Prymnesium parvum, Strain Texoma1" /LENGTH=215 /DNA_ID=CAMNT_0040708311 /DNA_START=21 /DNA_END=668 /DNA_ORIENTATION=-